MRFFKHILTFFLAMSFTSIFANGTTKYINKITYLFTRPDGDDAWRYRNHDDAHWKLAKDIADIGVAVALEKPSEVFVRIEVTHSPATLNNFYFEVINSGQVDIFINGSNAGFYIKPSLKAKPYLIRPRRIEVLGSNIYAIHFKNTGNNVPVFDFSIKNSEWICTDTTKNYPTPVINDLIRDAQACKGGDGAYYLTGTTGDDTFLKPNPNYWLISPGIQVFRSTDLKKWNSLGYVWTFDKDGTWNKDFGTFSGRGPARGIFAPEIKYNNGKYWINYSVNHSNKLHSFGIGLLWADKPEGPYQEVSPEKPITSGFDSNIFFDDDSTAYLLNHGGEIARLKKDITGLAEPFRHLSAANYPQVGYEGVHLFKYKGTYYLTAAEWNVHSNGKISYDGMIASSKNIYGPYGNRYCALRYGGHNCYFNGPNNEIYATIWCFPDQDEHWQKVSILKMKLNEKGMFTPDLK